MEIRVRKILEVGIIWRVKVKSKGCNVCVLGVRVEGREIFGIV